jgi:dTMP kinase
VRVFVTFEGLDGSGKSTQAELLRAFLAEQGREVVLVREPGGTPVGEAVRELLLRGPAITPWSEASLFAAARAELADRVIRPALLRGEDVVCDRFLDSSLVYQGIARGLGFERVLALNLAVVDDLLPDRTFVLVMEPEEAVARLGDGLDRIERETEAFWAVVAQGYRELADHFPERVVALDGTLPADEIADAVLAELSLRVDA